MNTFDFDFDIYGIFSNLDPLEWILSYSTLSASGGTGGDPSTDTYYILTNSGDKITTSDGLYLVYEPQ